MHSSFTQINAIVYKNCVRSSLWTNKLLGGNESSGWKVAHL